MVAFPQIRRINLHDPKWIQYPCAECKARPGYPCRISNWDSWPWEFHQARARDTSSLTPEQELQYMAEYHNNLEILREREHKQLRKKRMRRVRWLKFKRFFGQIVEYVTTLS